jgi:hypothetical protein
MGTQIRGRGRPLVSLLPAGDRAVYSRACGGDALQDTPEEAISRQPVRLEAVSYGRDGAAGVLARFESGGQGYGHIDTAEAGLSEFAYLTAPHF